MTDEEKEYKYLPDMKHQLGSEVNFQKTCARLLDINGHVWVHTPNEGKRSPSLGKSMREQGLKKGFPDICIHDMRLVIELKVKYNKPTADQIYWLKKFRAIGWKAYWVNSLDEFLQCYRAFK